MAGHRKGSGRPARQGARPQRRRARLASALTAEEQLAAAYDWLRSSLRRRADAGERSRVMREVAEFLAHRALALDCGSGDGP